MATSLYLETIKNKYSGGIVIVGNSPFLKEMDIPAIFQDYPSFCCNRFYLWNKENTPVFPTFYTFADSRMYHKEEQKNLFDTYQNSRTVFVLPTKHPDPRIELPSDFSLTTIFYETLMWGGTFYDGRTIGLGGTTANTMLQIAVWLGFTEFIFMGVDFSYTDSLTSSHFSKNYFDKNRHGAPNIKTGEKSLMHSIRTFKSNRKFFSANSDSRIVGEDVTFHKDFFDKYRRKQ